MLNKRNAAESCSDNILKIPQALHYMRDVKVIASFGEKAIFYKHLEQDLLDIEFFTNSACVIYIQKGREVITASDNLIIELSEGDTIFFPQGLNLFSDYTSKEGKL